MVSAHTLLALSFISQVKSFNQFWVFTTLWKKAQPHSVQLLPKKKRLFFGNNFEGKRGFDRQELTCGRKGDSYSTGVYK